MYRVKYFSRTGITDERSVHDRFADERRLEGLRQVLLRELEQHRGQRALAEIIGVGRSVIRKFIDMVCVPRGENLDKISDWAADRPEVTVTIGSVCLAVLPGDLPGEFRLEARRRIAAELAQVYGKAGMRLPDWILAELPAAEREAGASATQHSTPGARQPAFRSERA